MESILQSTETATDPQPTAVSGSSMYNPGHFTRTTDTPMRLGEPQFKVMRSQGDAGRWRWAARISLVDWQLRIYTQGCFRSTLFYTTDSRFSL